jgi:16S rRNA (guanine966-N2)-methyltransferase
MRVIAGSLGGRIFESPHGHRTHPMSEKARGGLFNALGDITGLSVLDAFTGTGALCFEAISRGAAHAIGIDVDKTAGLVAAKNVASLGVGDSVEIVRAYAESWSTRHQKLTFDLVFLDPPYDAVEPEVAEKLALHTKVGGITVFSLPPEARIVLPIKQFEILNTKSYGDATLAFYRRIA